MDSKFGADAYCWRSESEKKPSVAAEKHPNSTVLMKTCTAWVEASERKFVGLNELRWDTEMTCYFGSNWNSRRMTRKIHYFADYCGLYDNNAHQESGDNIYDYYRRYLVD